MESFGFAFVFAIVIAVLTWPTESAEVCRIKCPQGESVNICGRFDNICKRFANDCGLQLANCVNENAYSQVDLSQCRYIDLNTHRICNTGILPIGTGFRHYDTILNRATKKPLPRIIRV
ncbi:uncharacterized protein LOC129944658 isoform X2 [Eupeodes corollae]|uniref:uncharacterized protein LOC129944658 isoform X2 n=1 Tax=Eupeodes corollae TaxID=290404 RepID=UPI0024916703|nr:uncharacterized protein LOC129944658 isoform X2 [Eupeodes corollae]